MENMKKFFGAKDATSPDIPLMVHDGTIKYYSNLQPQPEKEKTTNFENLISDGHDNPYLLPLWEMFQYTDRRDKIFLVIGCVTAVLSGGLWPSLIVLDGYLLENFIQGKMALSDNPDCTFPNITRSNSTNTSEIVNYYLQDARSLCLGLFIVSCLHFLFSYIMVFTLSIMAENQVYHIKRRLLKSILRQDMGWFDSKTTEEFHQLVKSFPATIKSGLGSNLGLMLQTYSFTLTSSVVALEHGWKLTFVLASCITATFFSRLLIYKIKKKIIDLGIEVETYTKAGEIAKEVFENIRTVVAFGGEKKEVERYEQGLYHSESSSKRKGLFVGATSGVYCLCYFATLTLSLWYGFTMVLDSYCSEDGFKAKDLFVVFASIWSVCTVTKQNRHYVEGFSNARAAAKQIFEVIAREPPIDSYSNRGMKPTQIKGRLTFKDVYFAYPTQPENMILKGLSFEVLAGETVAVVDTRGHQKVFADLIERFYDPLVGQVKLDGKDLRQLNLGWLRERVGFLGLESHFFENNIAENIRANTMKAMQKDVERAAKTVDAHAFITALPDKYNTALDKRGNPLSELEKQKISIARVLLRNPKFILLDLTSWGLDEAGEAELLSLIKEFGKGRTTMILAQKLSSIRHIDKIVVIDQGQIKETGNHEELLAKFGIYSQMLKTQEREEIQCIRKASLVPPMDGDETRCHLYIPSGKSKSKEDKKEWRQPIWSLLKTEDGDLPHLVLGIFLIIFIGAAASSIYIIIGDVLTCLAKDPWHALKSGTFSIILLFTIGILISTASFFKNYLFTIAGERMTMRLRRDIFCKVIMQDMIFFDQHETEHLCSQIAEDTEAVQVACFTRMLFLLQATATAVTVFVISVCFNANFGLLMDAVVPLVVVSFYFQSKTRTTKLTASEKQLDQSLVDEMEKIRTLASQRLETRIHEEYLSILKKPESCPSRIHLFSMLIGCTHSTYFMCNALAMYYGSHLIYSGNLAFGDLFKVFLSLVYGTSVLSETFEQTPEYIAAKLAAVDIFKLLDMETKTENFLSDGLELSEFQGAIDFDKMSLTNPRKTNANIVEELNLKVKPGQTVALVGRVRDSKSACLHLLEKFYTPSSGDVHLDGTSIQDLDVKWLRSQMGLISRSADLFSLSVAGNIAYGDNSRLVSMNEIVEAAKKAGAHDMIKNLPAGYFTHVRDKAIYLSEGQKKQLAIARALVRNPKILLLDDAASGIEKECEKEIQQCIEVACEGRTCLVASSRISTVEKADVTIVFHQGQVVEKGTHEQLMAMQGLYYKLYIMQHDYSK